MKISKLIKKLETIPNLTTILRAPLGVAFLIIIANGYNLLAFVLYCIGALTDALDGFLARRLKETSKFGGWLDAMSDRIFIILVIIGLIITDNFVFLLKILVLIWIVGEITFGYLITKKIHRDYLSMIHKNSVRYAAFFLYVTLGGVIINLNFEYLLILVILTLIFEIYAIIDYAFYYNNMKPFTKKRMKV